MKKNSSFDNQIILREEETEITEIESITDLIGDLSQGWPNQSTVDERTFFLCGKRGDAWVYY